MTLVDAKARSTLTTPLVFVPTIGFRPVGTRTLRESTETSANGTKLMVLAVAAAPDRTDVVIEWELTGNPATCPPDSQLLAHSNSAPLEHGLTVALVAGAHRLDAITMRRRAYQLSLPCIGAVDAITFPALPEHVHRAELSVSEGGQGWHVPFALVPGQLNATACTAEVARDGVVVRATALSRYEDELIVEVEVEGPHQIRQVGAPVPTSARFSNTSEEGQHARRAEMHRLFGERSQPITLEDDRGGRSGEVRRLFSPEPQQTAPGQPFVSRFVVVFDAPSPDTKSATLVVPFVELNDFGSSVTADLRELPLELELGEHRFRLAAAEPYGAGQRKLVIEIPTSTVAPRFVQPARLQGAEPAFAWERHDMDLALPGRDAIWMATTVGDPPIVAFTGAVLRVDGPVRLEIPLP